MIRLAALLLTGAMTVLVSFGANAAPKPGPGADKLCSGFDDAIEGVWRDSSGHETLLFRLARNSDGSGCYAWLNSVSHWNIGSPGSSALSSISVSGGVWTTNNGNFAITADTSSGAAVYERGGRKTKGKLF